LLAFVTVAGILLARQIVRPILYLTTVANQLRGDNLDARAKTTSNDEIGQLGATLNEMAGRMKSYIADLEVSRNKINEQYQALNHEQVRLRASIESLDVGFIMTDSQDDIIIINQSAKDILAYETSPQGTTKLDVNKQSWTTDFVQARLAKSFDLVADINEALKTHKPVQRKEQNYNSRILRIFTAPVIEVNEDKTINKLGAVVLIEDITEAIVLERSKDEFFSNASHELRTPLTSIRGNSSMILDYYKDVLKDDQLKEMITDMHTSAIRLIEIVNDFLDVSRLEQGKVRFTYASTAVDKVIESVVYEMRTVSLEKKLYIKFNKLTLDKLPLAWADESRLKQVIYNLVGNAIKFTEEGGIKINARKTNDDKFIKVYVTDTGPGMSEDSQHLLFHKFQQAGDSLLTRDTARGTGMGLYISKMIVESMGGTIQLEHTLEGEGSVFSFTIPIATKERQAATKQKDTATKTDINTGLTK
jgi:signal transduction histidine kinase